MSLKSCPTYEYLQINPNSNNHSQNKSKSKGMFSKLMLKLKGSKSKTTSKQPYCMDIKRNNKLDKQNCDRKLLEQNIRSNGDSVYFKDMKAHSNVKKTELNSN